MTTDITTSPGPTESPKENLVRDLKEIAGKADRLLTGAGQSAAREFSATRHALSQQACGAANITHDYVRSNPWKTIGIAAAAGIFIGALISRRDPR